MSEHVYENENRPGIGLAAAAFVVGLVLAAAVLYFTMIAPRGSEYQEAQETIGQLEVELASIDERDAELRDTVASLEAELEGDRERLMELQAENERLEDELAEARALGDEFAESAERLEAELAELQAVIPPLETRIEQTAAEKEAMEEELRNLRAALEDREAELEEMREAYLVATQEVERVERERDEILQQTEREVASLQERLTAEERPAPRPQPQPAAEPYRYVNLLTVFLTARQDGIRADDPQQARAAWARAGDALDAIEDEFPDRSVDRLRQDLQDLESGS